jgi:hypothetical protein
MIKERVTWLIVAVTYIAVLVTLVRPGSKGTVIIDNLFGVFTDLVRGVAGQTFDPKTQKWSVASA